MCNPPASDNPILDIGLDRLEDTLRPVVVTQLRHLFEVGCGFPAALAATNPGSAAFALDTDTDANGADVKFVDARAYAARVGSFVQDAGNAAPGGGGLEGDPALVGCWDMATDAGWIGRPLGLLAGGTMPDLEGGVTAAEGPVSVDDDEDDDVGDGGVVRPLKRRRSTRSLGLDAFRLKSDLVAQVASRVQLS